MTRLRRLDWSGYLAVLAICFVAVWPFLSRAGLPQETDAELHIFRLAELGRLVQAGEWYPRWSPNFYFGYGYPIFNYYAPLAYYLGLLIDLLPTVQPVGAVKATFVLGIVLAGLGLYGLGRDHWGRRAGLVCAAVYVYAPYVQYIDPHARGVLAESLSFGVWAIALWSFDRLRRVGGRGAWLAAVLSFAAVLLAHNLMAMVFAGLLLAWLVWHGLLIDRGAWPRLLGAYGLGLGISAFFWLPVVAERQAVNLGTLVGEAGSHFDFHQHFLSLSELVAFSRWLDWGATEPFYYYNLGVAQWVLAGLGFLLVVWRGIVQRDRQAAVPLFCALAALALLFLMLPASAWLWERVPLLPFIQFPWRLLGATASLLALVAGYGVFQLSQLFPRWARWMAAAAVLAPILAAWPLTQPAPWPAEFGETSVARVAYLETRGRWLGTTSTADFVPATVDVLPQRQAQLVNALLNNQTPDRLNHWSVDAVGASARWEMLGPLHTRYYVSSPTDFLLRLFQFAFPGWEVRIDGQVVETEIGRPEGFLVIPTPAGDHVIDVSFVDTPPRRWGWWITLAAVLVTGGVAWWMPSASRRTAEREPLHVVLLLVVVLSLLFVRVDASGVLRDQSTQQVARAQNHLWVNFGDLIRLLGFDTSSSFAKPGQTIEVTVYWRAQRPLDINYQSFVHVLAADGALVAQADKLNPNDFPTRRWPLDKYVRDSYDITLPADLPAGRYRVSIGLWVQAEGGRLPVLDDRGQPTSDQMVLFELEVGE